MRPTLRYKLLTAFRCPWRRQASVSVVQPQVSGFELQSSPPESHPICLHALVEDAWSDAEEPVEEPVQEEPAEEQPVEEEPVEQQSGEKEPAEGETIESAEPSRETATA